MNNQVQVTAPVGNGIQDFTITNAADLQNIDFACWVSETENKATALTITKDATKNTVTFENPDKTAIQPFYVKNIYFGNSDTDLNLCGSVGLAADKSAPFYTVAAAPDLTKNTVSMDLKGNLANNKGTPDITVTLSVLGTEVASDKRDILNIFWTYTNKPAEFKTPYQVPLEIAGIDKTKLSATGTLDKWVVFTQNSTTKAFTLDIVNPAKPAVKYYTLSSDMQFGEYINVINGVAHTFGTTEQDFKGIMGLTEQTSNNLFLPDGVFSLWSLDTANPKQST
jgi:hypothetical protein